MAPLLRQCQHVLPVTAVSQRKLESFSNISETRAEVLAELARDNQMRGKPKPLSLLTLFTPSGIPVSDEERFLRERAVQLGEMKGSEVDCAEAVVQIKLTDGRILKRRSQGAFAVPLLLHSGTISQHGNQLLFEPWAHLEDVSGIQDEEETESQKIR